ncbi:MAG: CBS domain-containing protein [Methanobacteriota archaeon]
MKVREVMTSGVISVDKDVSLKRVLDLMEKYDVTKIPVLEQKKIVGIVSDNIIAYKLGSFRKRMVSASRLHASSVIEKKFETVSPDAEVATILRKVGEPGPTMLPVVEKGKLVGVVTKADLLPLVKSKKLVGTIVSSRVFMVSPDDRVVHARRVMLDNNVARLPVVHNGKLVGMISDREIAFAFASLKKSITLGRQKHMLEELLVEDVMRTPAVWIPSSMGIDDAARIMLKLNVGALPVLRGITLVGIISRTDLLRTVSLKS